MIITSENKVSNKVVKPNVVLRAAIVLSFAPLTVFFLPFADVQFLNESIWKELECMKRSSKPTPVIQSQQIRK